VEKKNIAKLAGSKMILGAIALFAVVYSFRNDAQKAPDSSKLIASAQVKPPVEIGSQDASQPSVLTGTHDVTISGCTITGGIAARVGLANCYDIHIARYQFGIFRNGGINMPDRKKIIRNYAMGPNAQTGGIYAFNDDSTSVSDSTATGIHGAENTDSLAASGPVTA
jgi:hypothetical protein